MFAQERKFSDVIYPYLPHWPVAVLMGQHWWPYEWYRSWESEQENEQINLVVEATAFHSDNPGTNGGCLIHLLAPPRTAVILCYPNYCWWNVSTLLEEKVTLLPSHYLPLQKAAVRLLFCVILAFMSSYLGVVTSHILQMLTLSDMNTDPHKATVSYFFPTHNH